MAHEMLGRVAAGQDPAAERARARAGPTLREAFEEYLGAGPERKASTIASYRSCPFHLFHRASQRRLGSPSRTPF